MKAAFYEGNRTFSVREISPTPPGLGEVKLKVAFCGVCGTDMHIFHGMMDKRVAIPQTIGHEMVGYIDELGEGVHGFKLGEMVAVRPLDSRGEIPADKGVSHICQNLKFLGIDTPGAFQEYWTVPAFTLHKVPENVDVKLVAFTEPLAVACHDVRLGGVKKGETVMVIGGGPIGMLIALTAREKGARVMLSEVNESRLKLAQELGFPAVNPMEKNVVEFVKKHTADALADVVFEVSGSVAGVHDMTELACIRGRIVMVAIHGQPKPVDLFKFFWKELRLIGARVYEPQDYEESLKLIASKKLPLETLISAVESLNSIQQVFENLEANPDFMKVLIDCRK